MENVFTKKDPLLDVINQVVLGEKKLTDAELKKREEIAQAIERENPGMDMGKKMAIATAQAKKVAEEVEQIDELSKGTLGKYIGKAVVDVHNDAKWAGESGSKDASNKAYKRLLGVKSAAARLSKQNVSGGRISNFRREDVNIEEQLENFWGAYLTCLDEAKDDASQQALLLRAMAKDPSDLMKMKRAIAMGDKALTNPVMRQEILKMLDQMMGLTVNDPTLLQKAKAGFQKAKRLPEEVEELDELSKGTLGNYIKKAATGMNGMAVHAHMSGSASSAEQREKHFDKAFKRGKGIAKAADKLTKEEVDTGQDAARKKQPSSKEEQEKVFAKHKERMKKLASEEVEQIDELSKKTLGSYIKKASGEAVDRAHAQANAENRSLQFARWHGDKKWKRMTGIRKAADKLTKEEAEQVDEAGYDFTHYRKMQYAQTRAAQKADDKPPFEGGREVKSSKSAAERVKKIAKGMQKKYTKKD